ncbi:hypothetical protein QBC34DRAFT_378523 [Podospora aff. communis PSN243]|uniref:Uncharacterized protein n=1 Tax=Podospora aff. communis PSN243 TaxID=3040156 RepID=A0AAV9GS38_9PEZI|nr:hypothetical protein QBC34DRAFT_378523 [Podospora aff. communis PSN243]
MTPPWTLHPDTPVPDIPDEIIRALYPQLLAKREKCFDPGPYCTLLNTTESLPFSEPSDVHALATYFEEFFFYEIAEKICELILGQEEAHKIRESIPVTHRVGLHLPPRRERVNFTIHPQIVQDFLEAWQRGLFYGDVKQLWTENYTGGSWIYQNLVLFANLRCDFLREAVFNPFFERFAVVFVMMRTRAGDLEPGECHVQHVECHGINFDVVMRCAEDGEVSGAVVIVGPVAYDQ